MRVPWVVRDLATGRIVGSTSYHDIVPAARRVEIGYTWYARSAQRTGVNTACKLRLLEHAFDTLGCSVVGWRTDILNVRSQAAIERLGAKKDGVVRRQALRRDGTLRDTVMYSVTDDEWRWIHQVATPGTPQVGNRRGPADTILPMNVNAALARLALGIALLSAPGRRQAPPCAPTS